MKDGKKEVILHFTKLLNELRNHFAEKHKRLDFTTIGPKKFHMVNNKLKTRIKHPDRFLLKPENKSKFYNYMNEFIPKHSTLNNQSSQKWTTQLRDKRIIKKLKNRDRDDEFNKPVNENNLSEFKDKGFFNTLNRVNRNVKSIESQKTGCHMDFDKINFNKTYYSNRLKQNTSKNVLKLNGKDVSVKGQIN